MMSAEGAKAASVSRFSPTESTLPAKAKMFVLSPVQSAAYISDDAIAAENHPGRATPLISL